LTPRQTADVLASAEAVDHVVIRASLQESQNPLMQHLSQSYSDIHQKILYELDVDTAIPCALVVTELISNAFKHAFPKSTPGRLS
jgi:two-component sensor histidine kinase